MKDVIVRKAALYDVEGIMNVHRSSEDPWHFENECCAWVETRLNRGFYIQVAQIGEKIIGHGEWVISEEPSEKMLYLGLLQVDEDYQRMGIGRAMVADGERYAHSNSCNIIVAIPDDDTGSTDFYEKCGFIKRRSIASCNIPTGIREGFHNHKMLIDRIPFSVISQLPFVFGLSQCASRHMWEVCNNKPYTDASRMTPACFCDGSYIQFSYYEPSDEAMALCWSKSQNLSCVVTNILSFSHECGLSSVNFIFFQELGVLFPESDVVVNDVELIKLM